MKKSLWKYIAAGAVLASLIPYKVKREENGDFEYRSVLLRVRKKTDEETGETKRDIRILSFGDDACAEDAAPEEESVIIIEDASEDAPCEASAEEAPAEEAAEAAAEETPACEPCEAAAE